MINSAFNHRKNLANSEIETFKPPLHLAGKNVIEKFIGYIRRFLDLQFGSIWQDLSVALPHVVGTVLDIGCGAQPFRRLFNTNKITYIGIDTIEAKPNFGYENNDTIYYSGKTLPIENEKADFILCTETLEHILEPTWLLNEMGRCLKNGGKILLTVPFAARWHFIPFDYWRYTPSSLSHLLSTAGFTNISVYARGNHVAVACYKVMGLMLPFLFSKQSNKLKLIFDRLVGLILLPFIFILAFIANIAILKTTSAEDCLGFTVLAEKH